MGYQTTDRILDLLDRSFFSLSFFMRKWECSRRTVFRDLEYLKDSRDIEYIYDRKANVYRKK